jgi:TetR/AcrR family transcriptional regulator
MTASGSPQQASRQRTGRPQGASATVTRRRILDASLQLFSQWGYDATRIKDVALKASVNAALVHHYFGDKDALYETVLVGALRPLKVLGQRLLLQGLPRDMLLAAWVEVLFTYFERHTDVLWLVTREAMGNSIRMRRIVSEALGPLFRKTVAALESSGKAAAKVDPVHLVVNAMGMLAVWHTHASLIEEVLGDEVSSARQRQQQKEQLLALLVHGALRH